MIYIFTLLLLLIVLLFFIVQYFAPQFGGRTGTEFNNTLETASNFENGKFRNSEKTPMMSSEISYWELLKEQMDGRNKKPDSELPSVKWKPLENFPSEKLRMSWFGHSSLLIEINGKSVLIDPVFSEFASPFPYMGPKAFDGTKVVETDNFTELNILLISHDHFDHLDYRTIIKLKDKTELFIVPLGVGAHLKSWGVKASKIIELNWWKTYSFSDDLSFTCTPARHFSGRTSFTRDETLWCSWVIEGSSERLFYSGDSGYTNSFKEIGAKFGNFDFAMLECGQYSKYWPWVHMSPEETALAASDLNAKCFMPVHWAKFRLSIHTWAEPVERVLKKANELGIDCVTPRIGESFSLGLLPQQKWWLKEDC